MAKPLTFWRWGIIEVVTCVNWAGSWPAVLTAAALVVARTSMRNVNLQRIGIFMQLESTSRARFWLKHSAGSWGYIRHWSLSDLLSNSAKPLSQGRKLINALKGEGSSDDVRSQFWEQRIKTVGNSWQSRVQLECWEDFQQIRGRFDNLGTLLC